MKKPVYEIKLNDVTVELSWEIWSKIQARVRSNAWFYIVHDCKKYKYVKDIVFPNRSTIFCFISLDNAADEKIELIMI